MLSRSPDRRKGGNFERSRDGKWHHEAVFYVLMLVAAEGAYLGSTEWALRWLEWFRNQTITTLANPSPPSQPAQLSPQQQLALQQAQQQAKARVWQQQIDNNRLIVRFHPDPKERQKAIERLQQMGETPPPNVIGRDLAAVQKR